jgi:putative ABC transport system substrate-binding protein
MRRRKFLVRFLGAVSVGWPFAVFAQQPSRIWRVGFFYFGSHQAALDTGRLNAFLNGMSELGYVEGKNLVIEARFADGKVDRAAVLGSELVMLKPDVIVATGSPTYRVLRQATTTIPVVITVTVDPVAEDFAVSLAKPGANFTGLTDTATDLGPKQLELLNAVAPRASRVAVLLNPDNTSHHKQLAGIMSAAQKIRKQVLLVEAHTVKEIESGFVTMTREKTDAVIVLSDTFFTDQLHQIATLALKQRLLSVHSIRQFAETGGLMSYGADLTNNFRRAGVYVDKILKGARPGEMPFEQPTRYSLVLNLKTAQAIGLTIPQSVLVRADKVIQ